MYIWTVSEIKTLIINSIPYPTPSVDHFIVDSDGRVVSLEGGRLWLAPAVVYVEDHPNNWWCRVNVDSCWRHGHWAAWASDRLDRHKVWLEETLIAGHSGHCWLQGQVSEVKVYDLCLSTTTGRGTDSLITGSAAGLTGATDLKHPTYICTQMMTDTVLKHPTNIYTQMMTDTDLKHPTYIYTQMMTDTVLKHPTYICTQMMTDTVLKHPTDTRCDDTHCYMEDRVELLIKWLNVLHYMLLNYLFHRLFNLEQEFAGFQCFFDQTNIFM